MKPFVLLFSLLAAQIMGPISGGNSSGGGPPPPLGYSWKATLVIDHTKVPNTDQTDFPILISSTVSDWKTVGNGGQIQNTVSCCAASISVPADLIFTANSSGTSVLSWEFESYDPATGAVLIWVKVPTVSHTVDTTVYAFYGKVAVTTYQCTPSATWSSGFQGVWHFGDGSTLSLADSTSNSGTLTNTGGVPATSGEIFGAAQFTGSGATLDQSAISIPSGSSITVSWWELQTTASAGNEGAFNIGNDVGTNRIAGLAPFVNFIFWDYGDPGGGGRVAVTYATLDVWSHIAVVFDSGSGLHAIYTGGVLGTSATSANTPASTQTVLQIGYAVGFNLAAAVDEFRVETTARSADWLLAQVNSQSSPGVGGFFVSQTFGLTP